MKKYMALILSIIALAAIITAAYAVYSRYGGVAFSPPELGSPAPDQAAGEEYPAGNDPSEGSAGDEESSTGSGESVGSGENAENDPADDGKLMVPDFTLKDLDGREVSLSDHRTKSSSSISGLPGVYTAVKRSATSTPWTGNCRRRETPLYWQSTQKNRTIRSKNI